MFGMFCSCLASGIWLMLATYMSWAVSTTHTTIGAILGFGLAAKGTSAISWFGVLKIIISWVISPLISGILSATFFVTIRNCVLRKKNPEKRLI